MYSRYSQQRYTIYIAHTCLHQITETLVASLDKILLPSLITHSSSFRQIWQRAREGRQESRFYHRGGDNMSKTFRLSAFGTLERQESHVAEILQEAAKAQRSKVGGNIRNSPLREWSHELIIGFPFYEKIHELLLLVSSLIHRDVTFLCMIPHLGARKRCHGFSWRKHGSHGESCSRCT